MSASSVYVRTHNYDSESLPHYLTTAIADVQSTVQMAYNYLCAFIVLTQDM
jgi:hypothetical protein